MSRVIVFLQVVLFLALLPSNTNSYFLGDGEDVLDHSTTYRSVLDSFFNSSEVQSYLGDEARNLIGTVSEASDFRVLDFVKLILPDALEALGISAADLENPFNFKLASISLDLESKQWSVGTKKFPSLILIPDFLILTDVTVFLTMNFDPDATSIRDKFSVNEFTLTGVWEIGDFDFAFTIEQLDDTFYFRGAPTDGELPVGRLITLLGAALLPAELEGPLRAMGLDAFSLTNFQAVGTSVTDGFALALSGNPTISGWSGLRCHLLITRYAKTVYQEANTVVTFAVNLPSFSLAGLIKTVSGLDVSDVPLIGSLTVPEMGLIVSSGSLEPNLLPEVIEGVLTQVHPIDKGVTLVAAIPFVPDQEPVFFFLRIGSEGIQFDFDDPDGTLTLGNLLSAIIPDFDISDLTLPPGISDLINIQLWAFRLTISKEVKTLEIELRIPDSLEIIPGIMEIREPSLYLNITLSKPRKTEFRAEGYWKFGPIGFPVSIDQAERASVSLTSLKQKAAKGFVLTGEGDDIHIGDIIAKFDADFLPDELSSILQSASLIDFAILRPSFEIPIGTGGKGFQLKLAGTPRIAGWNAPTINLVVNKANGKTAMAVGIDVGRFSLAGIIEKLTGFNVGALPLLNQVLQVAIAVSSKTMTDVSLSGEFLSQIPIQRGLSIVAQFSLPADCGGDLFCDLLSGALGKDANMQLSATITSLKQIYLRVLVNNIRLGSGLTLSQAGLEFALGAENYVGLTATLALSNPPISFTGSLRAGIQGLELRMEMIGIWERAFGINYFSFGNGIIAVTIKPGVPMVGLELGGKVLLGKVGSDKRLIIEVYLGIDPTMPRNNYFYGSVNKATIGSLLDAFDIPVSLPQCVAESGFPNGLLLSYSLDARELSPSGIVIPQGIVFNGTMNILGFRLSAYIRIGLPDGIEIDMRMSPLNLAGGLLRLSRSSSDSNSGPLLYLKIEAIPMPKVNVTIQGYLSLFKGMFQREVVVQITNTHFVFYVSGNFFLFNAALRIYAPYGSLLSAPFQVQGHLSFQWIRFIERKVCEIIDKAAELATYAIEKAQAVVRDAEDTFCRAIGVEKERRRIVNSLCQLRRCSRWCIGCPSWNHCCWSIWGACMGCPGWNSCCWTMPDLICEVYNFGCRLFRNIAYAALWAASKVSFLTRAVLKVAEIALKVAKEAVKIGAEAAKFIWKLGLNGGIISIKSINFDVSIGAASVGHFEGSLLVSFLGNFDKKLDFNLRLDRPHEMVLDLADAIFLGISGRKRREVAERIRRSLPGYSRRHYLPALYVHRPGGDFDRSEAVRRDRRIAELEASLPAVTYPKRDASDEKSPEQEAAVIEEELKDFHRKVESEKASESIPSDKVVSHHTLDVLDITIPRTLNTDEERCRHFDVLEEVIRDIPQAIEAVYEGWSGSVKSYNEEGAKINNSMGEVERNEKRTGSDAIGAREMLKQLREIQQNTSAEDLKEANRVLNREDLSLTELDLDNFGRNASSDELCKVVVGDVGKEIYNYEGTAKGRLAEQNSAAVQKLLKEYGKDVKLKTGLELEPYLEKLFEQLTAPYRELAATDPRYPAAVDLLESLDKIKTHLFTMIKQTVFRAKKLSLILLEELEEIDQIKIFCQ